MGRPLVKGPQVPRAGCTLCSKHIYVKGRQLSAVNRTALYHNLVKQRSKEWYALLERSATHTRCAVPIYAHTDANPLPCILATCRCQRRCSERPLLLLTSLHIRAWMRGWRIERPPPRICTVVQGGVLRDASLARR